MTSSEVRWTLAVVVLLVGLTLLVVPLVGLRTAESGCSAMADLRGHRGVSMDWSWAPLGTTCSFDGGPRVTRLLW